MRFLAKGEVDIPQLAAFTEHSPQQIERAALRLGHPQPGGPYDEYVSMHRWRYCPVCIQQGEPHQKAWLLPFVTACPQHGSELVDCCQECGLPHAVNLPMSPYCGSCQSFQKFIPAHPHELECSKKLIGLLENRIKLKASLDCLMTAWFLSTSEALRPHSRFSPQLRTVVEMRDRVIQIWPAACQPKNLAASIATQMEYLKERWPHFPHISNTLLDRAQAAGAHLPNKHVSHEKVELLRSDDPWWVPQSVAASAAGISDHIIQRMVDEKLIRSRLFSDIGEDGNRHKFRMVDLNDWHQLIEELYTHAIQIKETTGLSNILNYTLHEAVKDVRNGKMSLYISDGNTLSDLRVKFNETRTSERRQLKPNGTLTSAEVANLLDTYHAVVANLVERKLLKTSRHSGRQRLLITKKSACAFHKKYVLVGSLAKQYNLNNTNLAEKLASLGITPAPLKTLVTIYRRLDIEGVDIKSVEAVESYTTRAGRKSMVNPSKVDNPRAKKLIKLVNQHGGQQNFCRKFNYSPGTLSLMLRGEKPFGPLAARRMEKRCGLLAGALKHEH